MFLSGIDSNLFRPLVSPNAEAYGLGLYALYQRLIVNQLDGDECTPKEARRVIHFELINRAERLKWQDNDQEQALSQEEPDDASRIYRYLRECGWILEMDDVGYRRIACFPQIASQLLTALAKLGDREGIEIGAVCQGVFSALRDLQADPLNNSSQLQFAAKSSRDFIAEVRSISASTREIAYRMQHSKTGAGRFDLFFKEFMQKVMLRDFYSISTSDNPYRFRTDILSLVARMRYDEGALTNIVTGIASTNDISDSSNLREQVCRNLDDITRVFEGIDGLMNRINQYRSVMTKRTRESMRYALQALPEMGRNINRIVQAMSTQGADLDYPSPFETEAYLAPQRGFTPRNAKPEVTALDIKPAAIPYREIALSRVYDLHLQRRADNPARLTDFIEKQLGDSEQVTTSAMTITDLEDLMAYMQLRDLMHDGLPKNHPYQVLLTQYKVAPIPGETTTNAFIESPALLIERRRNTHQTKSQNQLKGNPHVA